MSELEIEKWVEEASEEEIAKRAMDVRAEGRIQRGLVNMSEENTQEVKEGFCFVIGQSDTWDNKELRTALRRQVDASLALKRLLRSAYRRGVLAVVIEELDLRLQGPQPHFEVPPSDEEEE